MMTTYTNDRPGKRVAYWITTGLLVFGMVFSGLAQVFRAQWNVDGFIQLHYPLYFMSILGTWKLLGVIAILVPGAYLVKEWAYAGFFFAMTGAVISLLASGFGVKDTLGALILALLTVASWYLRPPGRRAPVAFNG